jgi:hypothetical protein
MFVRLIAAMLCCTVFPCYLFAANSVPLEVSRTQAPQKYTEKNAKVTINKTHAMSRNHPRSKTTFYPGSLKYNIERASRAYGWANVVWKPGYDFHWVGKARVYGSDLQAVLRSVLRDYPLQAIFYQANHILVIAPRNNK